MVQLFVRSPANVHYRHHSLAFVCSLSRGSWSPRLTHLFAHHTKVPISSFNLANPNAIPDRKGYDKMSDIEKMIGGDYAQLTNTNIRSFGWKGVTVTVKDRQSQQPKTILSDINGIVKAGELLALMGPS